MESHGNIFMIIQTKIDYFFNNLPRTLLLLPLHGAVLLPKAQLPIPISDPNYLALVAESVKTDRFIGLVQPMLLLDEEDDDCSRLFKAGSVGKITEITEMENNRLVVTLTGVCRFDIIEELPRDDNFRKALVSYDRYDTDLAEESDFSFDRTRLLKALGQYFEQLDIIPNWQEIDRTSNEKLITALAMVCPFEAREKQALLESPNLKEQSKIITTLIEMAALEMGSNSETCH